LYGSCKSNYLYSQCLSPLKLWVRTPLRRGVHDTTLCDKVCQLLATGRWFSSGTPVSSTNKTDRHDITEILLKVALSTIKPNQTNHRSHCWKILLAFSFYLYYVAFIYIQTTILSICLYLSNENKLHHVEQIISINLWFCELFLNFVDIFLSKDFIQ